MMIKKLPVLPAAVLALLLCIVSRGEGFRLAPCGMSVYVDAGEVFDAAGEIRTDPSGRFYASAEALCRWIAPDFIRESDEGVWTIRRLALEEDTVISWEGKAFLDLEKASFCLRVDPYWLEEGIFSLLVRFSPSLTVENEQFERTCDTAPVPERSCDAVSPEGRGMWFADGDWWVEDDDGLCWRYAPAEPAEADKTARHGKATQT